MKLPEISSILFLGTNDVVALSAIRAIGTVFPRTSIHALSIASDSVQISNYSRYVKRHQRLANAEGEELLSEVKRHIEQTKAEILLPVDEESVRFVSRHIETLKKYVKIPPVSSVELLDSLICKDKLAELLKSKGFQTPETFRSKDLDTDLLPKDFFPCLMKPVRGSGGRGFVSVDDRLALEKLLTTGKYENYILQKHISGPDIDCSILAVDGEIKAYTIQRALLSDGYSFSKAICFENDEILYNEVERFIREIGFSGIAHLDYRFDDREGLPKLIDFNARYWSTLEGSKAAGIDFAMLNCLEALHIPYEKPVFKHCNYLLGRAVYSRLKSTNGKVPTFTDLKSRISDPLPELLRIFGKK